ncbi:tyrosine-type recombinase/integrase [Agrobacterium sp. 16-172Ci]
MQNERYQLGKYWLSQHNSPVYKATWYDADTGQTRRASLGTKDFHEAKKLLAEYALKETIPKDQRAADMPLGLVFYRYWEHHAKNIASADQAKYALSLWTEFWGASTVADLTPPKQKEFILWLKAKGYKNSYVSRTMSVGRSAVRFSWKNGEISSVPFIYDEPDRSDEKEPYLIKLAEMRRLLTKAQERPHMFIYCMIALNTMARPEAALQLSPSQVDLSDRWINLNPKGRKQTKKYRPIVPITNTLSPFLQQTDIPAFVLWNSKPIASVKKTFASTVLDAGLSKEITPYSLRHTMATELRRRGVSAWEIEGLLGHRRPSTTEKYAHYAPDYMSAGRMAIDAYFETLGLTYTVPRLVHVSEACQSLKMKNPQKGISQ